MGVGGSNPSRVTIYELHDMTTEEAFRYIQEHKPQIVHESGKTSTGKTTFAHRLETENGYKLVQLDQVVHEAVVRPYALRDEGQVFVEIYKNRQKLLWIDKFVSAAQKVILEHLANHRSVVVDGAVANIDTLGQLFSKLPDFEFIYFHPVNLENYEQNIKNRFLSANRNDNAGLPSKFWNLIEGESLEEFYNNGVVTPYVEDAIKEYAKISQHESLNRLTKLKGSFQDIKIVEI